MSYLSRTFGIEIEMLVPSSVGTAIAEKLSAAGIPTAYESYNHQLRRHWKVVTDGSLNAQLGYSPLELVSPILTGEEGFAELRKVGAVLAEVGCKVNKSCGLHCHVGARTERLETMKALPKFYAEYEEIIDSLMPSSRRASNNYYCQSIRTSLDLGMLERAESVPSIYSAITRSFRSDARYGKLNYGAYSRHGTVEFRQHSGTVDPEKIIFWAKACLRMVEFASKQNRMQVVSPVRTAPEGQRPRFYRIYELVARPEGASREEVKQMLGRNTAPPLNKIFAAAGITLEYRRGRYYLPAMQTMAVSSPSQSSTAEITLDGWMAKLEMEESEKTYWRSRRTLVADRLREAA